MRKWIILASVFLFTGCVGVLWDSVSDLSRTNRFWGGYDPETILHTKRPLLFDSSKLADHVMWPLRASVRSRVSFDEYVREPSSYPGVLLIPVGTSIRFSKLQFRRSFEYSALQIYGIFVDGPAAGSLTDLLWVSLSQPELTEAQRRPVSYFGHPLTPFWPDPAILEP